MSAAEWFRPSERRTSIRAEHKTKLGQLAEGARQLADCADKIEKMANQVAYTGGTVSLQPQINFLVGSLMRLQKDWAVLEHLQSIGAKSNRPLPVK